MTLTDILKKHPTSKFKRTAHDPRHWYYVYSTGIIIQLDEVMGVLTPATFTINSLLASDWYTSEGDPPKEIMPENVISLNKARRLISVTGGKV